VSGGCLPCAHRRARRVSASVEWCVACGAYRVAAEWVLPELAAEIPSIEALSSATLELEDAIAGADTYSEDGRARAVRLELVATFLSNLPPS
jgi:NMD protein affecting ribosome stability and mRNA decay